MTTFPLPPLPQTRRAFLRAAAAAVAGASVGKLSLLRAQQLAAPSNNELIIRSPDPFNAEPALAALIAAETTPVNHFYVRNHGPMPKIEASDLKLRVDGLVNKPLELSLAELRERFRQQSTEATLICGGNRRQEVNAMKPVSGVQWDAGAIGHARWTGAVLAEVLRAAELKENAKHVWFEGLDSIKEKDGSVGPFGGSIPLEKALAQGGTSLVAHAMNDQPLTAEHGAPLRMIVPGFIGARSVKWLAKITVSDRSSPNHYVAEAYKVVQSESKDEAAAKEPIYTFPVNAAICTPATGAKLKPGRITLSGYALPSGEPGCTIERVEISGDLGRSWLPAKLLGASRPFAWRLWTAQIELPAGKYQYAVRATDSKGHTMPERGDWNFKGYLYNGWHRVAFELA
jgi:sulfite oxidase